VTKFLRRDKRLCAWIYTQCCIRWNVHSSTAAQNALFRINTFV